MLVVTTVFNVTAIKFYMLLGLLKFTTQMLLELIILSRFTVHTHYVGEFKNYIQVAKYHYVYLSPHLYGC